MQQFSSLLSWRLFTVQHVSGVVPPIIRSSMTAVAASGFIFVSWWQSCCVRGRAGYCCIWLVIYLNCTMMHGLTNLKLSRNIDLTKLRVTGESSHRSRPYWFKFWSIHYSSWLANTIQSDGLQQGADKKHDGIVTRANWTGNWGEAFEDNPYVCPLATTPPQFPTWH